MDDKRRSKRKSMDDGFWDCSVCTFRNTPEAFKCEMCDVRKGTSTRKPRLNPQLVAQQVAQQFPSPPLKRERSGHRDSRDISDPNFSGMDNSNDSFVLVSPPNVEPEETTSIKPEVKEEIKQETALKVTEKEIKESPKEIVKTKESVKENKPSKKTPASTSTPRIHRPRPCKLTKLRNIDRSTARSMEVTVGDVTVIFTDYKPKKDKPPVIVTENTATVQPPGETHNNRQPTNNDSNATNS